MTLPSQPPRNTQCTGTDLHAGKQEPQACAGLKQSNVVQGFALPKDTHRQEPPNARSKPYA
jgi:hypothetical protein